MAEETSSSTRGPAKGEAYGMAAITQKLAGLDFPASKQQVLDRLEGDDRVAWTKDQTVNIRPIIEGLPDRFERVTDLTQAISDAIPEQGEETTGTQKETVEFQAAMPEVQEQNKDVTFTPDEELDEDIQ